MIGRILVGQVAGGGGATLGTVFSFSTFMRLKLFAAMLACEIGSARGGAAFHTTKTITVGHALLYLERAMAVLANKSCAVFRHWHGSIGSCDYVFRIRYIIPSGC